MTGVPQADSMVQGRRVPVTLRGRIMVFVTSLAMVAFFIWRQRYFLIVYPAWLSARWIWVGERPPSVVSATGISRPWHRRSFVTWNEVQSVAAPEPGRPGCTLNLVDGKRLLLADIPAEKAFLVAVVGGKQVAAPPTLVRRPSPPDRPKTDIEIAADVTRRAAILAVQRRELAAESNWLRGDRP